MNGDEGFVPLGRWLGAVPEPAAEAPSPALRTTEEPQAQPACEERDELDDALAAVRRFRAALDDALDAALDDLLERIAREIVGRELRLAPVDLTAIVAEAKTRYAMHEPLALRVHPDDVSAAAALGAVVADARLQRGEVLIELHSGTIDGTLAARLERLLAAGDGA